MKEFEFKHLFFEKNIEIYTEETMPKWMLDKENKWFLDKYILTLDVGEYMDTDFRRITRTK